MTKKEKRLKRKKRERIWVSAAFASVIISLSGITFLHSDYAAFSSNITTGDNLVKTDQFSQANLFYNNIKTLFPIQQIIVGDRLKNLTLQQKSHNNYLQALANFNDKNFSQEVAYLGLVGKDSMDYTNAQLDMLDAKKIQSEEDAVYQKFQDLLSKAGKEDRNNQLSLAQKDYSLAYQIASGDPVLGKDLLTLNTLKDTLSSLKTAIQKNNEFLQALRNPTSSNYTLNVPILMYHYIRVVTDPNDVLGYGLSVTPSDFEAQMNYIATHGYTTITMMDLMNALQNKTALPPKPIILTFDDGYIDFYTNAWPVLQKYNLKATSFIITNYINQSRYMTWDMVKELSSSGLITFGSHTVDHPDLRTLTSSQLTAEVEQSKQMIESQIGKSVTDFSYPYGDFNSQVENTIIQAGYIDAVTTQYSDVHPASNHYLIPRVRIPGGLSLSSFIYRISP